MLDNWWCKSVLDRENTPYGIKDLKSHDDEEEKGLSRDATYTPASRCSVGTTSKSQTW